MQRLAQHLAPMKLYQLSQNSLVTAELAAYEAGFALVEALFQQVKDNCFIQTCAKERLIQWEKLLLIPSSENISEQSRREILLYRLAVAPGDFYAEGMERSIKSTGVDATIIEHPPLGKLTIVFNFVFGQYENLDSVKRQIYSILPAHLEAEFDIGGLTWAEFDQKNYSFADLDTKDFTWQWFDVNGVQL